MSQYSRICKNCQKSFPIFEEDAEYYRKIQVPLPTWCPDCRAMRRMIHWNERFLFRKKDGKTGKEIFSTYPEASPIKIYNHDFWWSDGWDPMSYGREYDFKRPFFEQFRELMYEVPWPAKSVRGMVNSDYCNQASYDMDCYLCFNGAYGENCLYGVGFNHMKDALDFYWTSGSQLCYDISFAGNLFQCFYCDNCEDSRNLILCRDCNNCADCFGCIGLRNKQYYIFNQPYTKEEYLKKIEEYDIGSHSSYLKLKEQAGGHFLKYPNKYTHGSHNKNVIGDYVYSSRNVYASFQGGELDNVRYSQNFEAHVKDSWDYTNWGEFCELIYEASSVGDHCKNIKFSFDCWPACENLEYCMDCHSCSNCFGCIGLNKKEYCIFNKQYSATEYYDLVVRLKQHMDEMPYISGASKIEYKYGEFFPVELSPLAYNETVAIDYFPAEKKVVESQGMTWREPEAREFKTTLNSQDLADHIRDVSHEIVREIIKCFRCGKAYRILERELELLKKFSLPLPRLCHECRHAMRVATRNPLRWWKRSCMCNGSGAGDYQNQISHFHGQKKCPNEFETSYSPQRREIVYCEQCYNSEVV